MNSNASQVISEVNRTIHKLRNVKHLMREKTHLMVANCSMKSKLSYGLPLYIGSNQQLKNRINVCMMSIARWIKGNRQFMIPNSKICRSIKWSTPNQMILQESMITIYKMLKIFPIKTMTDELRKSKSKRKVTYQLKFQPKREQMKRNMIYMSLKIFNMLPDTLKDLDIKKFKLQIKKQWIEFPPTNE